MKFAAFTSVAISIWSCVVLPAAASVIPAPGPTVSATSGYAGYLFAYFIGEGYPAGEQIYFAVSNGTSAAHWIELNSGRPVLTSTVGTRGARDPSIVRYGQSGFKVLATDLKMYGNGDWADSVRNGSKSIIVWDSSDLVDWGGSRLIPVSPTTAGNTWAPAALYDPTQDAYHTIWASSLYPTGDPSHSTTTYNRILASTTRDFIKFSPATIYDDPGWSVIDTTMVRTPSGTIHRFSKDERSPSGSDPNAKFVFQETAPAFNGPWRPVVAGIGKGFISRGEGPVCFADLVDVNKWHLFIDEFGGRGYVPFETTDIAAGKWIPSIGYQLPQRPRHGSVIPITASEMNALLRKWGPK